MSDSVKHWIAGIAASLIVAAITGLVATVFGMGERIAKLEATQTQLIKQIDRTLDALTVD